MASKFIDVLTQIEALAMSVYEILLQMRDIGHGLTPTGVQIGLLISVALPTRDKTCYQLRAYHAGGQQRKRYSRG
jgi:hypothetical protein